MSLSKEEFIREANLRRLIRNIDFQLTFEDKGVFIYRMIHLPLDTLMGSYTLIFVDGYTENFLDFCVRLN